MGYHRAGFDVVGVDNRPMPRYPFEFHQADALEYLRENGREFDAIHASPPCQAYSVATKRAGTSHRHPDMVDEVRQVLRGIGKPWVIENVPGSPLQQDLVLCGSMFGLEVRRHRIFETEPCLWTLVQPCDHSGRIYSVFGHGSGNKNRSDHGSVADWKRAMGIDWMIREELIQAIPPAYCEYIGRRLIERLRETRTREGT